MATHLNSPAVLGQESIPSTDNPELVIRIVPTNIDTQVKIVPMPGAKGDKGDKGDQGEQGIQGVQGIQGIQGIQGEVGPQGQKGDQGDQGIQGIQGPAGALENLNVVSPLLYDDTQNTLSLDQEAQDARYVLKGEVIDGGTI